MAAHWGCSLPLVRTILAQVCPRASPLSPRSRLGTRAWATAQKLHSWARTRLGTHAAVAAQRQRGLRGHAPRFARRLETWRPRAGLARRLRLETSSSAPAGSHAGCGGPAPSAGGVASGGASTSGPIAPPEAVRFDPKVITTLHKMDAFTHTLLDSLKMGPVAQELGLFAQELASSRRPLRAC